MLMQEKAANKQKEHEHSQLKIPPSLEGNKRERESCCFVYYK